ncbi:MAG: amidohydrolase [Proteobacteria bacterium]|nr:amidohydrolase [Pseudomonadota bacterium]
MAVINRIAEFHDDMTAWRRHLHAHPETAFEEHRTADFVAARLGEFGIEVHRGLARTGVVGTLKAGSGRGRAIALRADIDALPIAEETGLPYRSTVPGKMHACGHDGHTAMLLGAARYLAETRAFDGTVHFLFQPAEENEGGAWVMIEEGLFDRFPVEAVYGLHNWPSLPAGTFGVRAGPVMAAFDTFEVRVHGKGAHGAMPHLAVDPVVVASQLVNAYQTIVSRTLDPCDAAVVSVTLIQGGSTWNVIPDSVVMRGTTRHFRPEVQDRIERRLEEITANVALAFGARAEFAYFRNYPATVNPEAEARAAAAAAGDVVGTANVAWQEKPSMAAEDFAFLLQRRPGCYLWLGAGKGADAVNVHNPRYDFNDDILAVGASYWARLVERELAKGGG